MKQILSISNIVLFVLAAIIAFAAAEIVKLCGGDQLSAALTGVAAGIVCTMLIGGIAEACKWKLNGSPVAGAIGAFVGLGAYLIL